MINVEPTLKESKNKNIFLRIFLYSFLLLILISVFLVGSYFYLITPASRDNNLIDINIPDGSSLQTIGKTLESRGLIRNARAFYFYNLINHKTSQLKSGTFKLSASQSVADIVGTLIKGSTEKKTITFLPGSTIMEVKETLLKNGFKEEEVEKSLKKDYSNEFKMLESKPKEASLEGFIFGETYNFSLDVSSEVVIKEALTHMQEFIDTKNLEEKYKAVGLDLYKGLILSSIVEREMANHKEDMPKVAQVFELRLKKGMKLGSDVTYQYGAKLLNVKPSIDLDSPYNTRKFEGLPPTPISSPSKDAMLAVANPSDTDYLFFVSGDDEKTYFSKTVKEHEELSKEYCKKKCETP